MKRQHFFILAALVPGLFGLVMMVAPQLMLNNSLVAFDETTRVVTQWVSFGVFSLAVINYLTRHDPASPALRAVITGNIPHLLLIIGFIYYMRYLPVAKEQAA